MRLKIKGITLYPIIFFVFFLIIVLASLERWTYYVNLIFVILTAVLIFSNGKIKVSSLRIGWAIFLLLYAVFGYHLVNSSATFTYSLPYISVILLLFLADGRVQQYKIFQTACVFFAIWQAFGFLLQMTFNRLYVIIAWRLLGRWSPTNGGFTTDRTVAAFIISVGIIFVMTKLQENGPLKKSNYWNIFALAFLNLGLALSGKRALFGIVLLLQLCMYIANSKNQVKMLRRCFLAAFISAAILGVCILTYHTAGTSNIFGRLGYTVVGYLSGEDVSSSRNSGYAYMQSVWSVSATTKLFGIGWRNVQNGLGRLGHGVYREILCETGYLGLAVYIILIGSTLVRTMRNLIAAKNQKDIFVRSLARNSFYIQVLFLLYSITGNAIYDPYCYLYYFMAITMSISAGYHVNKGMKNRYGYRSFIQ